MTVKQKPRFVRFYPSGFPAIDDAIRKALTDANIEIAAEERHEGVQRVTITAGGIPYKGVKEITEYIQFGTL